MALDFRLRILGSLLIAACALAGCSSPAGSSGANPRVPETASSAVLRSGDSLTISLQGVPDPSTNVVQVDEQGLINLPYVGSVLASGLSASELQQRIRETYISKKIYTTVDVSVSVTERFVYVGGEVAHPGRIIWTPDLTVAKAIQAAGGFTLYAKEAKVNLVRDQKAYEINAALAQKDPSQDARLMPGDSLQVPRSPF
jgi:protein involved in polysaccharide export with SLBB domain